MLNIPQLTLAKLPQSEEHQGRTSVYVTFLPNLFVITCVHL